VIHAAGRDVSRAENVRWVGRRGSPAGTSADALLGLRACRTYAAAFTASGRTDLLFRVEDRDLFLAECLIWKGPKSLTENLVQLFGGATSADVRLALIAFVPERVLVRRSSWPRSFNSSQNSRRGLAGNRRVSCAVNSLNSSMLLERVAARARSLGIEQLTTICPVSSYTLIGLLSRLGVTTLGRSAAGAVRRPCRPWQRTSRSLHSARRLPAFGGKATRGVSDGGLSGVSVPILPRPRPAPLDSCPVAPRGALFGGCERTCSRLLRGVEWSCVAVGSWAPGG
jgi:hypothetical protein